MDIKVNFEYVEEYFPTARSRKKRYRALRDTIIVPLKEVAMDDLRLAYRIDSHTEIYSCQGKLYRMIRDGHDNYMGWRIFHYKDEPLKYLQEICLHDEHMFSPTHSLDNREKMEARVRGYLGRFLVADGVLFVRSPKPVYVVETSGIPFLSNANTHMNVFYQHEHMQFPATNPVEGATYAAEIAEEYGCVNLYGKDYQPRIQVFPGAGEPVTVPKDFDADEHKHRLEKLCGYSKATVSAMEPICSGICKFVSKDPENLDLYCNQCKALQIVRDMSVHE